MKKLICLLFMVVLFSCEKNLTYCWKCNTLVSGETVSSVYSCDQTEEEIKCFEVGLLDQAKEIYKGSDMTKQYRRISVKCERAGI